jgi:hypothetical protein
MSQLPNALQEAMSSICEALVVQELRKAYALLEEDISPPMFSWDAKEEKRKVKQLRKSFKQVMEYYGAL